MERIEMIKHAHEEIKRLKKMRALANSLGVAVETAQMSFDQAKKEVYRALENHPALQAQLNKN